ncbi:sensor histidine kinase [Streptomyces scopuliridis]|uniref:histidine kinase n=1 Tax=Streptomyces scopuliridis RB72 TaxID=1440053 RepID=A0A2T7T3X2_9ACTN|nr:sensor histidine kinase [Streptomyces scopuliridis]PVE09857.1 histidine kinase [Streptomyces scopuliridis RB72]
MIKRLQQQLRDHPRIVDVAVAVVFCACSFPGSAVPLPGRDLGVPWWPGVLLGVISSTALLWRHGRPRTTAVVTGVCAIAMTALGYILTVLLLGPLMVALYALAVRTDRRTANGFAFTGIALLLVTALIAGPTDEPLVLKLMGPVFWLLLPTSLGTATRLRAAVLEAVQARAEHAERTREEDARRRVTEERLRIARELHDVVAHHLVLAKIQAGVVARSLRSRPAEAERIVTELAGTTSSALRELRAAVGLLRHTDDQEWPLDPVPGLAQLPELIASFKTAGLTVTVTGAGEPRPLSAGADLAAYRIVQEALTNVTKHAASRSAAVRLAYSRDRLGVTITNEGGVTPPSSPASGSGYGLVGMRERALSVGGRLRAGRRAQGGFEVVAELPLHPSTPDEAAAT